MPDFLTLSLFALACLALAATPGPDMLLIASRSIAQGRRAGFATLAGIQVGTYCHAIAAALGLSSLFLAVPLAYDIVRYVGALYLLYLAVKSLRAKESLLAVPNALAHYSAPHIFRQGLITNLLNPKVALFVLALFPQFLNPAAPVFGQMVLLATLLNVIGFLVNGAVIQLASKIGAYLTQRPFFARWANIFLGSVFAALACRLLLSKRA